MPDLEHIMSGIPDDGDPFKDTLHSALDGLVRAVLENDVDCVGKPHPQACIRCEADGLLGAVAKLVDNEPDRAGVHEPQRGPALREGRRMRIIGIDPGLGGAVAVLTPSRSGIKVDDMPIGTITKGAKTRPQLLPDQMVALLEHWPFEERFVVLEQAQPMPKQSVASTFTTGKGFGIWIGILTTLKIPHEIVRPQEWKQVMLAGRGKDKDAARIRAAELFPELRDFLKRKQDHGRAEALLLAEYGRRLQLGHEGETGLTTTAGPDGCV